MKINLYPFQERYYNYRYELGFTTQKTPNTSQTRKYGKASIQKGDDLQIRGCKSLTNQKTRIKLTCIKNPINKKLEGKKYVNR